MEDWDSFRRRKDDFSRESQDLGSGKEKFWFLDDPDSDKMNGRESWLERSTESLSLQVVIELVGRLEFEIDGGWDDHL